MVIGEQNFLLIVRRSSSVVLYHQPEKDFSCVNRERTKNHASSSDVGLAREVFCSAHLLSPRIQRSLFSLPLFCNARCNPFNQKHGSDKLSCFPSLSPSSSRGLLVTSFRPNYHAGFGTGFRVVSSNRELPSRWINRDRARDRNRLSSALFILQKQTATAERC